MTEKTTFKIIDCSAVEPPEELYFGTETPGQRRRLRNLFAVTEDFTDEEILHLLIKGRKTFANNSELTKECYKTIHGHLINVCDDSVIIWHVLKDPMRHDFCLLLHPNPNKYCPNDKLIEELKKRAEAGEFDSQQYHKIADIMKKSLESQMNEI
jgi:hypothetical protein